MTQPIRLFVYGTLRPGHAPASVAAYVDRCRDLGSACTAGRLYDLRNYPGAIVESGSDGRIFGQLLELPSEAALKRLDAYEGYNPADPRGSLFVRTECDVTLDAGRGGGETVRAFVYVYNRDVADARVIPDGRYHPNSAMRRPVIGITMDHKDDGSGYQLTFDYSKSIEAAGGLPFAIPYKTHPALIPQYVDLCDGILFTGGNDLDPKLYGDESWHPKAARIDPDRQAFELALLAEVERRRTPCLGVCLGSQIMNVHRGGSLVQFLPDQDRDAALEHRKGTVEGGHRHAVKIEPGTILSKAIGKNEIVANTRHKQAVSKLGRGLRASAFAPDGVIEAIEDPSMPLYLAVQWHPENLAADSPEHLAPFKLLVEKAAETAKK